jgi:hypothetical protein
VLCSKAPNTDDIQMCFSSINRLSISIPVRHSAAPEALYISAAKLPAKTAPSISLTTVIAAASYGL